MIGPESGLTEWETGSDVKNRLDTQTRNFLIELVHELHCCCTTNGTTAVFIRFQDNDPKLDYGKSKIHQESLNWCHIKFNILF